MPSELTNEELALWCEGAGKAFGETAAMSTNLHINKLGEPMRNSFNIIAERLRKPSDSSRVRETAKEPPEGDYSVRVLAFDRRCQQWREADVGCIRDIEGRHPGKGYYTHWLPLPPRPEVPDVG